MISQLQNRTKKAKPSTQVNTIDKALDLARVLSRDLRDEQGTAIRSYRIFIALAANEQEGLAAYLIWRARAEAIHASSD